MTESGSDLLMALPRPTVLRDLTDGSVLNQVFEHGRITRAELSHLTGISKPTVSESVRRLTEAGLLTDSGSRTGRRGRVATFYELNPKAGWVMGLELHQGGLHSSSSDLAGRVFHTRHSPAVTPGRSDALVASLRSHVMDDLAAGAAYGQLCALSLSVANPVDPDQHIIALPHSPFPEGLVNPRDVLSDLVSAPVLVDNDVNLAALAERAFGAARTATSFGYLYVGAGLGFAHYTGGQLVRGAHGLAGEIGYLPLGVGRTTLMEVLIKRGLGRPGGWALDVGRFRATLQRAGAEDAPAVAQVQFLCDSLAAALAAVCAVTDPEFIVLGGPIGKDPRFFSALQEAVSDEDALPVRIERGTIEESASLRGALHRALGLGRGQLLAGR